ncbi:MAG: hypothetical protein M3511_14040 [Deinococcota bacterium]|nr:hypothetical protein [Deinococcota bacterium]
MTQHCEAPLEGCATQGGWLVPWPLVSPGCELEWRGWLTLDALRVLRANGRLEGP